MLQHLAVELAPFLGIAGEDGEPAGLQGPGGPASGHGAAHDGLEDAGAGDGMRVSCGVAAEQQGSLADLAVLLDGNPAAGGADHAFLHKPLFPEEGKEALELARAGLARRGRMPEAGVGQAPLGEEPGVACPEGFVEIDVRAGKRLDELHACLHGGDDPAGAQVHPGGDQRTGPVGAGDDACLDEEAPLAVLAEHLTRGEAGEDGGARQEARAGGLCLTGERLVEALAVHDEAGSLEVLDELSMEEALHSLHLLDGNALAKSRLPLIRKGISCFQPQEAHKPLSRVFSRRVMCKIKFTVKP